MIATDRSSADIASVLLARGFSVIPIPRPSAAYDGKRPAIPWKEFQTRHATDAEIRAWFAIEQNLGIVTGAISGVVVVDVDDPAALAWVHRRLPYTPWQTRTPRGFHLFYRHPGRPVRNAAKLDTGAGRIALDVRADGGFVVAPGSVHASGKQYEFAGKWEADRTALPTFWPGWLERRRPQAPAPDPRKGALTGSGFLIERARRYLAAIPPPEIGAGSDVATLNVACRLVRGFALPEADALDLIWQWAGGRPGWSRAWVEEKVANAAKYGTEPIGALQ